jgi:hypothetical protein
METMQPELPSPSFWRCAVDRLHLSPSQVLHFKVAAQEYRRLMRWVQAQAARSSRDLRYKAATVVDVPGRSQPKHISSCGN